MDPQLAGKLVAIHNRACTLGERTYSDPVTGFTVLTEVAHKARGRCCGNACRHCPYNWENVDPDRFDGVHEAREDRRRRREAGGL